MLNPSLIPACISCSSAQGHLLRQAIFGSAWAHQLLLVCAVCPALLLALLLVQYWLGSHP